MSPEKVALARRLERAGHTRTGIAEAVGVTRQTLRKILGPRWKRPDNRGQCQVHRDEAKAAAIYARYMEGVPLKQIAEEFGYSRKESVSTRLRAWGYELNRRPKKEDQ